MVGMKAMVTFNVTTDVDLSNGSRGVILEVALDPREENQSNPGVHILTYPPAMVLFKPDNECRVQISGLPEGVIPIFPVERTFQVSGKNGKKTTVTRRQLPITPGYAYTDYRGQGQTIEYVIVDVGKPPSFALSAFNAYVALSRS
jgi:ATP-dependent exoDNAse (exonuclease V) alpha subunit